MFEQNEWKLEFAGFTQQNISWHNLTDLIQDSSISDVIDSIERLQSIFGEKFEKLYELQRKYDGGTKQYFKQVKKGICRCGGCDDIYEYWICTKR